MEFSLGNDSLRLALLYTFFCISLFNCLLRLQFPLLLILNSAVFYSKFRHSSYCGIYFGNLRIIYADSENTIAQIELLCLTDCKQLPIRSGTHYSNP